MSDSSLPLSKGRFHFLIVPRSNEENTLPVWVTAETQEEFLKGLYGALVKTRAGWCFLIVDGQRAALYQPEQSFRVGLPDGTQVSAAGAKVAISQDGSFCVLEPVE
jgi:hypothetical protein